ncbi:cytochrome P450 [Collybia nuda]|uniref:Cytochrome P450 n=1 Tax=Collybia nuda TaxID=64659 RepID=A0A9P6CPC1_9AGAR|nr:cytochrome P450 [Collybia nuda]
MGLTVTNVVGALSAAWLIKSVLEKAMAVRAKRPMLGDCPGGSILWIHPFRTSAIAFGPIFPFVGQMGYYFAKFSLYAKYGSTCLSSITFWNAIPIFWLSDGDAIKALSADRKMFPKDVEAYETLNIYGPNIIGTEGADWKRHRSVANSAFNEANNALVWRETIRLLDEWFAKLDLIQEKSHVPISVNLLKDLTQITLLVVSSAGFGRCASLRDDSDTEPPPGHKLAFRPAVASTMSHLIPKVLTPDWIYDLSDKIYIPFLTPMLSDTREGFEALRLHMVEIVSQARAWIAGGKTAVMDAALLRNLVEASMVEDGNRHLTDDELLSDTFSFLLAGHETSAHSLCFAVMILAAYPEIQQRVYEESVRLWPHGVPPPSATTSYKESMAKLEYTTAVFHETLRLYPAVARLAKVAAADKEIKARQFSLTADGKPKDIKETIVPIKAGSVVIIDVFGLHANPIHWGEDNAEFKPERFLDTEDYRWPREAFHGFSSGPRSCIGQRFALTESVCILAHIVRRYRILTPGDVDPKIPADQQPSLPQWTPGVTIIPKNARIRLQLREKTG